MYRTSMRIAQCMVKDKEWNLRISRTVSPHLFEMHKANVHKI
jgi:hypothetical protein